MALSTPPSPPEAHPEPARTIHVRASRRTLGCLLAVGALLPAGVLAVALPDPTIVLAALVVLAAACLLTWLHLRATVTIIGEHLEVRGPGPGFRDRLDNFVPGVSSKLDYRADRAMGLRRLCLGAGAPGFRVGWFELRDRSVGYACLSRRQRARALRTRDGCALLLDPGVARQVAPFLGRRSA